jgi:hypothetical protein
MDRRQQHLRMRDLLQHLGRACQQWVEAEGQTAEYLAQSIDRQLAEFHRLIGVQQSSRDQRRAA